MKTHTVTFVPEELSVEVQDGTTILAAARQGGVIINSLCGGDGVCGKCKVIVRAGKVQGGSTELLTREEIRQGYILGCEARVESDLVVEVPAESRIRGEIHAVDRDAERFSDIASQVLQEKLVLDPLVRKYYLELPRPSLENNSADLDRLEGTLLRVMGTGESQMGLKAIRMLPDLLRGADWKVTATCAYRGVLSEITEIAAGDTTGRNFAVAVDIGTTTVVAHLVNLDTGETLGTTAKYNSQIAYGGDVIRRIIWATSEEGGLERMHRLIVDDINALIGGLQEKARTGVRDITLVTAAGNTTMMHMLLDLDPAHIRREPYIGVVYTPPPFRAAEVGLQINKRGLLYCLPMVSSFVGADIAAGVLAAGIDRSEALQMLIDIGTNGEIVIGNRDFLMCASASAGPAFEGSESRDGMRATSGAIDHVSLLGPDRVLSYSTIGDDPAVGICGTGYVDLLAELLREGLIDKTGKLLGPGGSARIRINDEGVPEYVLVRAGDGGAPKDVVITQFDIENMLRAKAAVYSASLVLLNSLKLSYRDIETIYVAGAFGNYLNVENAVCIGLLPDESSEKIRFIGNTSITGAKLVALSREKYRQVQDIASRMTYFELSTDHTFMDEFVRACFFPHTDIEKFPNATARMKPR